MHISSDFTPLDGLAGGLLIGIASALMVVGNGRIFGNSGIVRGFPTTSWKRIALGSMITTGGIHQKIFGPSWYGNKIAFATSSPLLWVVGGLCVGVGTTLANGCTSGHGVCGLARFSVRSLVAVLVFMSTGALTASNLDKIQPLLPSMPPMENLPVVESPNNAYLAIALGLILVLSGFLFPEKGNTDSTLMHLTTLLSASIFATGLALSHMCDSHKVHSFLAPLSPSGFDPSLAFTMGGALLVTLPTFSLLPCNPKLCPKFDLPAKTNRITASLVVGSALFGLGWGLCGACPGPAVVNVASGSPAIAVFLVCMFVGMQIAKGSGSCPAPTPPAAGKAKAKKNE